MLTPGTPAPALEAQDQHGNAISLSAFAGKKVALFFYPKDDTPTCTKEACNLRDNYTALLAKGIQVVGISVDPAISHQKFIAKHELPYPLIADTERALAEAFGVWGQKSLYGNKYMGILRTTFLIDEQGTIIHVIDKVKSGEHATQILKVWGLNK